MHETNSGCEFASGLLYGRASESLKLRFRVGSHVSDVCRILEARKNEVAHYRRPGDDFGP